MQVIVIQRTGKYGTIQTIECISKTGKQLTIEEMENGEFHIMSDIEEK